MKDLTLITCSYNTPEITLTLLRSFTKYHIGKQRVIIMENSTNSETVKLLDKENIPYVSNPGDTHGDGVNKALELCQTKYALLVDTDIIFLKNHSDIFEQFKNMELTLMGNIEMNKDGERVVYIRSPIDPTKCDIKRLHKRVDPWHCFINVENIKKHNIKFFDKKRMEDSFKTECRYDVGSTFFEDIRKCGLKIGNVNLSGKYFNHIEGMSWYANKYDPSHEDTGIDFGGTHNNSIYVNVHKEKQQLYNKIYTTYSNIQILDKFTNRETKLLIKFPTRSRSSKFLPLLDKYYSYLSGKTNTSFLITCDIDDVDMNNDIIKNKLKLYKNLNVEYLNNKNKIEAINAGLNDKEFDIVLLASDDMIPQIRGYDEIIVDKMCEHFPSYDGVLWFNDGTQGDRLNTLCILGRKYYDKFGYIYHPDYKSLWCDMEFTIVGNMLGKQIYFNQCIIKHEHHSITGVGFDKIYYLNEKNENMDKKTFLRRQMGRFDI